MERATFNSTNLKSMEYDNGTLRLAFNAGGTYEYYNVPQQVVAELQQAQSAGSYFHSFIRNKYAFKKVA
jgi:lysyl-tRNA synthetase class 2